MSYSITALFDDGSIDLCGSISGTSLSALALSGFDIHKEYGARTWDGGLAGEELVQLSPEVARLAFIKSLAWAEGLRTLHMEWNNLPEDDEKRSLTVEEYWCDWYDDTPWDIAAADREAADALVTELVDVLRTRSVQELERPINWVETIIRFTWAVYQRALLGPVKLLCN